jgi:hypothetical protein
VPETATATESYEIRAEVDESYARGELGQFALSLEGTGKWHLNLEYPTAVELDAPEAVKLPRARLTKDDAAEFAEEKARFDIPFTPQAAGSHRLVADIDFAVCTPSTCVPKHQKLAVVLPAR